MTLEHRERENTGSREYIPSHNIPTSRRRRKAHSARNEVTAAATTAVHHWDANALRSLLFAFLYMLATPRDFYSSSMNCGLLRLEILPSVTLDRFTSDWCFTTANLGTLLLLFDLNIQLFDARRHIDEVHTRCKPIIIIVRWVDTVNFVIQL